MRASEHASMVRILAAARAPNERALPGEAQRAVRMLVRLWASEVGGVVALVDYAHQAGYVDALADIDQLAAVMVDVNDLPETGGQP